MDTDDTSGCSNAVNLDILLSTEYTHMYMRIADAACVQVIILSIQPSAPLSLHFSSAPLSPRFSSALYPLISPSALYPTIHSFIHSCALE